MGDSAAARPGGLAAAAAATARGPAAAAGPRQLWRRHRLITILVIVSFLPRILASLAFRPALLTADSFLYMQEAANGTLGVIRPSGYSWFLDIFRILPHTLLAVTTAQHLMGIATAVGVYALLRYWGLPGWGASLAALPTLFDTREIALESFVLPDTLYGFVLLAAVALLLTRRTPRLWQCAAAGLLVGLRLAAARQRHPAGHHLRRVHPDPARRLAGVRRGRGGDRGARARLRRSRSTRPTGSTTSPAATACSCGRAPRASPTARSSSRRRGWPRCARPARRRWPRPGPRRPGR